MDGISHLCMICGREYNSEEKLEKHQKLVHEIKLLECTEYSTKCGTQLKFNNHMRIHRKKTINCKVCNEEYPVGSINWHMKSKHEEQSIDATVHRCDMCTYETDRKGNLLRHKINCLREKKEDEVLSCCDVC